MPTLCEGLECGQCKHSYITTEGYGDCGFAGIDDDMLNQIILALATIDYKQKYTAKLVHCEIMRDLTEILTPQELLLYRIGYYSHSVRVNIAFQEKGKYEGGTKKP